MLLFSAIHTFVFTGSIIAAISSSNRMAANYGSLFGQVHNMWKGSSARPFNESLFVKSCFATKSLHCQELKAHKWGVSVLEFADNGQFFASGGCDDRVLLWSIDKALGSQEKPILVLSPHIHGGGGTITSLAFSPDNNQVFSSGYSDKSVFIYDITTQVLYFVCFHDDVIFNHIFHIYS